MKKSLLAALLATALLGATSLQVAAQTKAAAPLAAPAAAPACANPNAIGVSRVVEIDTTSGPGFGFEHFNTHDFLQTGEVVLTFDDGPWPKNTQAVLDALAAHCTKATFFPIGKHALYHPEILKEVAKRGHTIGSHTWAHLDLSKQTPAVAKDEIEKGVSAVSRALQGPAAPFFRFPALKHPPEMVTYLGSRNIAVFSTDFDSFDFKIRRPEQVVQSVMTKLKKKGKGIALMHDFQQATAKAVPDLLNQLKAGGYKIVHLTAKDKVKSLPDYDVLIQTEVKGPATLSDRPTSSVVKTIGGDGK